MKKLGFLFIALVGFAVSSKAVDTKTATANATARIVKPITIHKDVDLAYGLIGASAGGGVVLMNTAGTASVLSGTVTLPTGAVTRSVASFTVSGDKSTGYAITLPANGVVTLSGTGTAMAVDNFKALSTGVGSEGLVGMLDATNGQDVIKVGAELTVNANQASGSYTSTFDVTVDYN